VTWDDLVSGKGRWVMLDLPLPYEPVFVDMERPLEEQLPAGPCLEAAKKMVEEEPVLVVNADGA
jgi:hypothetical protein